MHNGARDWSFWWCDACVTQPIFFTQEEPQKSFLPPHSTSSYISPLFLSYLCLFFFGAQWLWKFAYSQSFFKVWKTDLFHYRRVSKPLHNCFILYFFPISYLCLLVLAPNNSEHLLKSKILYHNILIVESVPRLQCRAAPPSLSAPLLCSASQRESLGAHSMVQTVCYSEWPKVCFSL